MKKTICFVSLFIVVLSILAFTSCSEKTPSSLISNNSEKVDSISKNDTEIISTELSESDEQSSVNSGIETDILSDSSSFYESDSDSEISDLNEIDTQQVIVDSPEMPQDKDILNQILSDYIVFLQINFNYNPEIDGKIWIERYYGQYSGAIPVIISGLGEPGYERTEIISDSTFFYTSGHKIIVWKNGYFYSLQEAFDNNILSSLEIKQISIVHNKNLYICFNK